MTGNAPAGSEGPAWRAGIGALRFGAEVGGELLGQRLLGPAKGAVGLARLGRNMFGAGVGGAAGSVLAQTGFRQAGTPPPSIDEIGRGAVTTGLQAMAGEGMAAGVTRAWNKAKGAIGQTRFGRPMASKMTDEGRLAEAYMGGHVTPAQVTEDYRVNALESLLKGTPLGGGRFRKFLTTQEGILREKAAGLINQFGPRKSVEEAGDVIVAGFKRKAGDAETRTAAEGLLSKHAQQRAAETTAGTRGALQREIGERQTRERAGQTWQALQEEAHTAARTTAGEMYKAVDEVAGNVRVPLDSVRDFVDQEIARRSKLGMALAPGGVKEPSAAIVRATTAEEAEEGATDAGIEMLRSIAPPAKGGGRPELMQDVNEILADADAKLAVNEAGEIEPLTFAQAHSVRSAIGRRIRVAERSADANAKHSLGFLKQLYGRMDDAMTEAAGGLDSEVRTAYDAAGKAWKGMAQTYEEGLLAEVAEKEPRLVVDTLIQPGRIEDIQKAQKAVGKDGWKQVQRAHLDSLLRDDTGGWADAKALQKKLAKLTPETVEAVYGKSGTARITDYVKSLLDEETLASLGKTASQQADAIRKEIPEAFEALAKTLRNNDSAGAKKLRALVGTDDWPAVQSAYIQKLMFKSGEELVTGERLLKNLHDASPAMLKEVFPDGQADGIWQFARVLHQLQKQPKGAHFAQISAPFMQVGALVSVASGSMSRRVAALLSAPPILARIVLSPTGRQLLTSGLKEAKDAAPGTANRALSQLATWAVKEGLIDPAESGRPGPPQPTVSPTPATGRGGGPGPRAGSLPPSPVLPGPQ